MNQISQSKNNKDLLSQFRLVKDFNKIYNSSKNYWNEEFLESLACCGCDRNEADEETELWKKIKMSVDSEEIKSLSNSLEKMEIDDGKVPLTSKSKRTEDSENHLKSEKYKVIWTDKEEKLLIKLCQSSIKKKWKIISNIIGTKTASQCNYKFKILCKQGKLNEIKNEENLLENAEALGYFQKKSDVNQLLFDKEYKKDLFKKLKRRKNKNISALEKDSRRVSEQSTSVQNNDVPPKTLGKKKSSKYETKNSSMNLYQSKFN